MPFRVHDRYLVALRCPNRLLRHPEVAVAPGTGVRNVLGDPNGWLRAGSPAVSANPRGVALSTPAVPSRPKSAAAGPSSAELGSRVAVVRQVVAWPEFSGVAQPAERVAVNH